MSKSAVGIMVGVLLAGWVVAGEHPEHPKSAAPAAAKATAGSVGKLDGKVFVGEIGKKGDEKGDKDEFVFKQGTFVSIACVAYGFNEAPYVTTEKGGQIVFTSEPKNAKAEKMSWKGTVKNGQVEGTAVYQTESGKTEHWFKGTLKTAATSGQPEVPTKPEHPEHPK